MSLVVFLLKYELFDHENYRRRNCRIQKWLCHEIQQPSMGSDNRPTICRYDVVPKATRFLSSRGLVRAHDLVVVSAICAGW
jgi:hypothetical protein